MRWFTAKVLPALFREHYDTPGLAAYGSMQIIGRFVAREFRMQKSSKKHVCGREEQKANGIRYFLELFESES